MIESAPEQTEVHRENRPHILKISELNSIEEVEKFSTGFEDLVVHADIEEADKAIFRSRLL